MITIKQFEFNPFGENTYVLSDETREAVVVDCGCMMARERSALSDYITEHGLTPVRLLCTQRLHPRHVRVAARGFAKGRGSVAVA